MNINDIFTIEQYDEAYEFVATHEYTTIKDLEDGTYQIIDIKPTPEEEERAEKERIAHLHLTGADVERGIYQAKGLDFDDIIALVEKQVPDKVKPLKIELKANNFYRGNPYVEVVGKMLGFTDGQLNMFFDTNNYLYLTDCTFTINPTPAEATVIMNDTETKTMTVPFGTIIKYSVSQEGYKVNEGSIEAVTNLNLDIILEKEEVLDDSTTDKQPNTIPDETTITTDQG